MPLIIKGAAIGLIIIALADLLRFQFPLFERWYENALGYFMRESERDRVNGTIYYLVGVIVVLTFFPRGTLDWRAMDARAPSQRARSCDQARGAIDSQLATEG